MLANFALSASPIVSFTGVERVEVVNVSIWQLGDGSPGMGAAIAVAASNLTYVHGLSCTFANTTMASNATYAGGSCLSIMGSTASDVVITDSRFLHSYRAVNLVGSARSLLVTRSAFLGNMVGDAAGGALAVLLSSPSISITTCRFDGNTYWGSSEGGGALAVMGLDAEGILLLADTTFANNNAAYGYGAGVYIGHLLYGSYVFVQRSFVLGNTADFGGWLAVGKGTQGSICLNEFFALGNSATAHGGLMHVRQGVGAGGNVTFAPGCRISGNSAQQAGGVLSVATGSGHSSVLFQDVELSNNTAGSGGVLAVLRTPATDAVLAMDITFEGCNVKENKADGNTSAGYGGLGGLLYTEVPLFGATSLVNMNITGGSALQGAVLALNHVRGQLRMKDSHTVNTRGGVVVINHLGSTGAIEISSSMFMGNSLNAGMEEDTGGALANIERCDPESTLRLSNVEVSGGSGKSTIRIGGLMSGSVELSGVRLLNASTIRMADVDGSVVLRDSVFLGNAAESGSVLSVAKILSQGIVTLTDLRCTANSASADGGVIAVTGDMRGTLLISGGNYTGNVADSRDGGGGVVMVNTLLASANISISDVTSTNNSARYGGFLSVKEVYNGADISVRNSTFASNGASTTVGGVMCFRTTMQGRVVLDGATFVNNRASQGGVLAATCNMQGTILVRGGAMQGNAAMVAGGVVHFSEDMRGNVTFWNTHIMSNVAELEDGAVMFIGATMVQGAGLTMYASLVTDNSAGMHGGVVYATSMDAGSFVSISSGTQALRNRARGGSGGVMALASLASAPLGTRSGTLIVSDAIVSANSACSGGGVLHVGKPFSGTLTFQDVVLEGNSAASECSSSLSSGSLADIGGGIMQTAADASISSDGSIHLLNATCLGNRAPNGGVLDIGQLQGSIQWVGGTAVNNTADIGDGGVLLVRSLGAGSVSALSGVRADANTAAHCGGAVAGVLCMRT